MEILVQFFEGNYYRNLVLFFSLLFYIPIQAGEIALSNHLTKTDIVNGATIRVIDNTYPDEVANPTWYAATRKHLVRLTYHRESRTNLAAVTAWTFAVNYMIYETSTGGTGAFEIGTLLVSHSPGSTQDVYEVVKQHALNYADATIKITTTPSVTGTPPTDIRLELTTVTERYMDLELSSAPSPLIYYNSTVSELSWGYIPGAEEYDVEWTFIDNEDIPPTFSGPEGPFAYKTPVRITTGNQFFVIDRVYPKGKLYFRVRGVGRHIDGVATDYTHLNYTQWGYKGNISPMVPALSYTITTGFEENKNWSYSAAYAEQAKVKKGIGYADGNGKSRQSIATMNSDNTVIVGENKYDLEGRPVLSILPTPVDAGSPLTALGYKGLFNPDASGTEYNSEDFQSGLNPFGNTSGAGKYYSSQNPFTTDPFKAYIPDAGGAATAGSATDGGFPFTQVQYTRDNTGRVSQTTSGAGTAHNLEEGHELNYYYASANSTELHRMFGTNVGVGSHYKKNMAIDANGQMSISYYDQEERVIATCLTGNAPGNLRALDDNSVSELTVSLNGNNIVDPANQQSITISNILNVIPNTEHSFTYDMKGVIYAVNIGIPGVGISNGDDPVTYDSCQQYLLAPICTDCKYKLEITVTDPDGLVLEIPDISDTLPLLTRTFSNPDNPNCENNQYDADGVTFALTFTKIGNYTVSKKLVLDTTGIYAEMMTAMATAGIDATYKNELIQCYINHTDFSQCDITCEQHCRTLVLQEHTDWAADQVEYADEIAGAIDACEATNCNMDNYCEQNCSTQVFAAHPTWDVTSPKWDNTDHTADIATAVQECIANQCGGTTCNVLLDQMMEDVSPAGKWFAPREPDECSFSWDRVEEKLDDYTLPSLPAEPSASDLADPDYIILLGSNGLAIRPQPGITFLQNPNNWTAPNANPQQWAGQLIKAHGDYCHYQQCLDQRTSTLYNLKMAATADYTAADALGFIDPMGMGRVSSIYSLPGGVSATTVTGGIDPMFETQSITAGTLYKRMADALSNDFAFGSYTDIWHYVNDPASPPYATAGLTFNAANKWLVFRGLYLDKKTNIFNSWNTDNCPYCDESNATPDTVTADDAQIQEAFDMSSDCAEIAALNATYWMDQLLHYLDSAACGTLNEANRIAIKHNLMLYCQANCGLENPMGYITATAINAHPTTHIPNPSDVYLTAIQGILNTAGCNTALNYISAGEPYTLDCPSGGIALPATVVTGCFKELIKFIDDLALPTGGTTCYSLNNALYPLLQSGCLASMTYLNVTTNGFGLSTSATCTPASCSSQQFRFYRADGTLISTADMQSVALPVYTASYPGSAVSGTFTNVQCVLNSGKVTGGVTEGPIFAYLFEIGSSTSCPALPVTDDGTVTISCMAQASPAAGLPSQSYEDLREACIQNLLSKDTIAGTEAYNKAVIAFKEQYMRAHYNNCFNNYLQEDFYYEYNSNEYHYTLYYYDQAGNLTQTVPPKGVHLLSNTAFTNGKYDGITEPAHTYRTRYTYNSLNQVLTQQTPDGGLTAYYYDYAGRLRFSQNAKQVATGAYSYTRYDNISRIIEVGQSTELHNTTEPFYNGANDQYFPYNIREQLTITAYDAYTAPTAATALMENGQQFLRTRVAATKFYESAYANGITAATYYSYDEHGNVKELVQDNNLLASLSDDIQYKYMEYDYELVSGNVKQVAYQPGKPDQFYHKYIYDADNRLTIAMTSNHEPLTRTFDKGWEKDAKYFYYKHGPLARTETGEDKVQGTDYAYTINGWLKGINATTLYTARDMGKDANLGAMGVMDVNNKHNLIATDALGYTLGYYDGDYTSIASSTWEATTAGTSFKTGAFKDLFNGNITHTTSAFRDNNEDLVTVMGKIYTYDQLNRLKTVNAFTNISGPTDVAHADNTFSGATDGGDYKELFSYDPNGNITAAQRWGNGTKMDDFVYNYEDPISNVSYTNYTNKLRFVGDDVALVANYTDDIDDQAASYGTVGNENYDYDAIGNLIKDQTEEIDNIEWNVYGKVTSITRASGSTKKDLVFKYDPSGQRICKIVKDHTGSTTEENWNYTYYVRDAQGNVMAVYDRDVNVSSGTVTDEVSLKEHDIYGSSRVGIETKNVNLGGVSFTENENGYDTDGTFIRTGAVFTTLDADLIGIPKRLVGDKQYELVNHLGNVMVTVTDKKQGMDVSGSATDAEYYLADVSSAQDNFAFGAAMPGRTFNPTIYSYGFGGQLKDDEIYGTGNSYSAEFWQYDSRLGRRWNTDPIIRVWESCYATFENNPIYYNDLSGATTDSDGDDKKKAPEKKGVENGSPSAGGWNWITPSAYENAPGTETKGEGYTIKESGDVTYVHTSGVVPTFWVQYNSGTSAPAPTVETTSPSVVNTTPEESSTSGGKSPTGNYTGKTPGEQPKPSLKSGEKPSPILTRGGVPKPKPIPTFDNVEIPDCSTKKFSFEIRFQRQADYYDNSTLTKTMKDIAKLSSFLKTNPKLELTICGNVAGGSGNIFGNSIPALNQGGFVLNGNNTTAVQLMTARAQSVHRTLNIFSVKNPIKIEAGNVFNGAEGLKMDFYIKNPCKK